MQLGSVPCDPAVVTYKELVMIVACGAPELFNILPLLFGCFRSSQASTTITAGLAGLTTSAPPPPPQQQLHTAHVAWRMRVQEGHSKLWAALGLDGVPGDADRSVEGWSKESMRELGMDGPSLYL